jgi:hypothetical protein
MHAHHQLHSGYISSELAHDDRKNLPAHFAHPLYSQQGRVNSLSAPPAQKDGLVMSFERVAVTVCAPAAIG